MPRFGVAAFLAAMVCGQLVAALAHDHVGAFGVDRRRAGLRDIAGIAFLFAGLAMAAVEHRT